MPLRKQNCWEYTDCEKDKCNRCPAFRELKANGINGGINGGRVCWAIDGTFCDSEAHGTYAEKVMRCSICDFRIKVQEEEGYSFRRTYF